MNAITRIRNPGRTFAATFGAWLIAALVACTSTGPAPVTRLEDVPAPPGYYRIQPGDTLSGIAERQGIEYANLIRWNAIEQPDRILSGGLLAITPETAVAPAESLPPVTDRTPALAAEPTEPVDPAAPRPTEPPAVNEPPATAARPEPPPKSPPPKPSTVASAPRAVGGLNWQWPLNGKVVRTYASGDITRQGVRIAATPGAAVKAAEAGTVVYSGNLKGYGNLVIVKHNDHYVSAYGYNRRLLVSEGQKVARGDKIAEVGGPSADGVLHFEIRRDGDARDPLGYLPSK